MMNKSQKMPWRLARVMLASRLGMDPFGYLDSYPLRNSRSISVTGPTLSRRGGLANFSRCVGVLSTLLLLSGCSKPIEAQIIGKWRSAIDRNTTQEFFRDNSFIEKANSTEVSGKWTRISDDQIKLDVTVLGNTAYVTLDNIRISEGRMTYDIDGKKRVVMIHVLKSDLDKAKKQEAVEIASLGSDLSGTWKGTYTCSQGLTGLSLEVLASSEFLRAKFIFYPITDDSRVLSGAFSMTGQFAADRSFVLSPDVWIDRPGEYGMVGLNGKLSSDGKALSGSVVADGGGCSEFSLQKQ